VGEKSRYRQYYVVARWLHLSTKVLVYNIFFRISLVIRGVDADYPAPRWAETIRSEEKISAWDPPPVPSHGRHRDRPTPLGGPTTTPTPTRTVETLRFSHSARCELPASTAMRQKDPGSTSRPISPLTVNFVNTAGTRLQLEISWGANYPPSPRNGEGPVPARKFTRPKTD